MARVVLVRHGRAAAGFGEDVDPGLDAEGRAQAQRVGDELSTMAPVALVTSPLRRARETAAPLASRWRVSARVEHAVGEIPSPTDDLAERVRWLEGVLATRWSSLDASLRAWRAGVVDCLTELPGDAVVFTHFVVVNVAVGAALGDDRVVVCHPANASRTVFDTADGRLRLVASPDQDTSAVV